jgi:uncharacterized protein involved in type VI secretion and phage assembly
MPVLHNVIIKIEGQEISTLLQSDLIEVIVDTTLCLPGSFSLLVANRDLSHDQDFDTGKKVEISFVHASLGTDASASPMIHGIITAIEPIFSADGTQLLRIRGYEKSIKLSQGKKTRTFVDMTDADIVKKIVGEAGISATTDSTSVTYPHLIQYNQNDWDFMLALARQIGYLVWMSGETLNFKKPPSDSTGIELKWPEQLTWFEPRLSFLGQVAKATVSGWDTKQKQIVTASAETADVAAYRATGLGTTGKAAVSKNISSSVTETVLDLSLISNEQATKIAQAQLNNTETAFVTAEGECQGMPNLVAGCTVKISGVSAKYAGKYLVTQARHEYNESKYTTQFSINGAAPETILSLMLPKDGERENRIDGVVTAVVTNTKDPENATRVKVKYPWLLESSGGNPVESGWARLAVIGGGKDRGIGFMPEVDDEVLVAFANGDINAPYIVGALWNSKDTAPKGMVSSSDGKILQRVVRSRSGHIIILDDTEGSENITIKDKTQKNSIVIKSSDNSMTIQSDGDLTLQAKGKLILKSNMDASLESAQGKTMVKGATELALSSAVKASIEGAAGAKVDLQASGTKVEGINVDISGTAKASLKGSAMVEISGLLVKIN